jgi:hypothetical protein
MTTRGYLRGKLLPVFNTEAIDQCWSNIEGLLERIVDEKVGLQDIYKLISTGEWVLWLCQVPDTEEITSVVITTFIAYPRVKNLRIIFLSGDDEDWSYGIEVFEDFARINKCHDVEILGRKGWERTLRDRGYEFQNVTLRKRIA